MASEKCKSLYVSQGRGKKHTHTHTQTHTFLTSTNLWEAQQPRWWRNWSHTWGGVTEGEGLAKPVLPHTSRSVRSEDPDWRNLLLLGLARIIKEKKWRFRDTKRKTVGAHLSRHTRITHQLGTGSGPTGNWFWSNCWQTGTAV
jgi:hypothetical protein